MALTTRQAISPAEARLTRVLADQISSMWINFAKTGDPSIEGFGWPEYNLDTRATMVVGQDSSLSIVNDPKGEQRKKLMPLIDEFYPVKKA